MRFYRDDQVDLWEDTPPPPRDENLRELVDELPEAQQHLVSRVFFGGAPLTTAAGEIGLSPERAGAVLAEALEGLRDALQEED